MTEQDFTTLSAGTIDITGYLNLTDGTVQIDANNLEVTGATTVAKR